MSACHLCAAISAWLAGVLIWLEVSLVAAVLVSYLAYLRAQLRTFTVMRKGIRQRSEPGLIIGEQSARLNYLGKLWETQLPSIVYMSEFLVVLNFRPEGETLSNKVVTLVLWPDSLRRCEDRRLRRYLRFELPRSRGVY